MVRVGANDRSIACVAYNARRPSILSDMGLADAISPDQSRSVQLTPDQSRSDGSPCATSAGREGRTSDMASKASDRASDSCCIANWKLYQRICSTQ